jgi:hypothetical protein
LIIYVCKGYITASEFFKIQDLAALDKDYKKSGMTAIVDLFAASVDFELDDLHHVINFARRTGFEYGKTALLSENKGVHLTVNSINLLSNGIDLKINSFATIESAIVSFGLSENMQEIIQFWTECKSGV